jgi:hypothetical protein
MKQCNREREREREREKKERKKKRKKHNDPEKSKHKTKKRAEKEQLCDEHVLRHTFYIFFFSPSLKGERKERRGRFDLHNNAQKHTENTRAREKESVRRQNHTRFFTETRVSLRRRTKGRGDSWSARF